MEMHLILHLPRKIEGFRGSETAATAAVSSICFFCFFFFPALFGPERHSSPSLLDHFQRVPVIRRLTDETMRWALFLGCVVASARGFFLTTPFRTSLPTRQPALSTKQWRADAEEVSGAGGGGYRAAHVAMRGLVCPTSLSCGGGMCRTGRILATIRTANRQSRAQRAEEGPGGNASREARGGWLLLLLLVMRRCPTSLFVDGGRYPPTAAETTRMVLLLVPSSSAVRAAGATTTAW